MLWLKCLVLILFVLVDYVNLQENFLCCSEGYKLQKTTSKYQCVPLKFDEKFSKNELLIKNTVNYTKPPCDPTFIKVNQSIKVNDSNVTCLANFENQFFFVYCPNSNNIKNTVKKCCPWGQSYSFRSGQCVLSEFNSKNFLKLVANKKAVKVDDIHCSSPNVIVDYFSDNLLFDFDHKNFLIGKQKFGFEKLCLEDLIDEKQENINKSHYHAIYMARTCQLPSICETIPCVRKCCDYKEKYVKINGSKTCIQHNTDLIPEFHHIEKNDDNFTVMVHEPPVYGVLQSLDCIKYKLSPDIFESDLNYINHRNGHLHVPTVSEIHSNNHYCMEFIETSYTIELATFLCFEEDKTDTLKFKMYSVALIISSFFLAATLVVYLCVPKLLNLHGKTLACHVVSMLLAYIGLVIVQYTEGIQKVFCYPFAFIIYYCFLATFTWLNVMCFDIWWTFGSTKRIQKILKASELRRFVYYSIYGWGVPLILTAITFSIDYFKLVIDYFRPNFGDGRCWFSLLSRPPHIIYFLIPIGILIFTNTILFILTFRYCNKVKVEINRMQQTNVLTKSSAKKRFIADKARFIMNTKIFVIMGVSWIFEIISASIHQEEYTYLWYALDLFNALQGTFVFAIFVCKRAVWTVVLQKCGIKRRGKYNLTTSKGGTTSTNDVIKSIDLKKITGSIDSL